MFIKLIKSPNKRKKYRVIFENKSKVDFGAAGYSDYTLHKDPSENAKIFIAPREQVKIGQKRE
jgi:hypothetical protein